MDVLRAVVRRNSINCTRFVLLIAYLAVCCDSTLENRRAPTEPKRNTRFRRFWHSAANCSESQCFGNETQFNDFDGCKCDEACYKTFSDCCPNYESVCGRQEPLAVKTTPWKCVKRKGIGYWMISRCPADWRLGQKLKTRCENAPSELSFPAEDFIPVTVATGETYQNRHCALCHGVKNYTSWQIRMETYVVPPDELDLDRQLKFVLDNGGTVDIKRGPRLRSCPNTFIKECNSTDQKLYRGCVHGPVEVVGDPFSGYEPVYFKNRACAICNGYKYIFNYPKPIFGSGGAPGPSASLIVLLHSYIDRKTIKVSCPGGTVYDPTLKICRKGHFINNDTAKSGSTNTFAIVLWFKPSQKWTKSDFESALASRFSLQSNQISELSTHYQGNYITAAAFRLKLTPFQNLIMANQRNGNFSITRENAAFLELVNFSLRKLDVSWGKKHFSVIKVTSKRLSCYDEKKLQSHEYKFDKENRSFIEKKTGRIFSLKDYSLVDNESGNITLCRILVVSSCSEGAFIPLSPTEYVVFPNLTVYHNVTRRIFNYGEYIMNENKGSSNNSSTAQNFFARNFTVSICLPFKNTYTRTVVISSTNYAQRILTTIGFSVSITSLVLLLITYGLFKQLRKVPGLNLMNMSLSVLLSQLLWCVGISYFVETKICKVLAILQHYLFLASFLAMSVMSYHSYLVFSRPFAGRFINTSWRRFIRYSLVVWWTPAIFVATCVTLDKTGTFVLDYGTDCWLGTQNGKLYFFLLPLAIILVYNICTFIRTAVLLYHHGQDRETLQGPVQPKGKQNLRICVKLATLVGFTWLFAFLAMFLPDVEALEYLFIIFVSLQGLYIGMTFIFNKKILNLYQNRWNTWRRGNPSANTFAPTFEMTSHIS